MSFWEDFKKAYENEIGVGQDESAAVMYEARKNFEKPQSPQGTRWDSLTGSYRTAQAVRAAVNPDGQDDNDRRRAYRNARAEAGIPIMTGSRGERIGTIAGAVQSDLIQDSSRRIYWLLNAAQATGDVIAEQAIKYARPDLYDMENKKTGKQARRKKTGEFLYEIDPNYETEPKTYKKRPKSEQKYTRKYPAGLVQLTAAPAGLAINTGLGLMTPFGGAEGYKAALPSEDDPTKTANVLGEVAMKYIMGRTGDLLPYNEFVKVRPDVSPEEYRRYKAFKYDKPLLDVNPFDDGQMGAFGGAFKYTNEGIHGPEIQFLGRSLPATTGIIPFASAVAGAAAGVAKIGPATGMLGYDKPIRRGFGGGMAGFAAGQIVGNLIEGERRRRNAAENERDTL